MKRDTFERLKKMGIDFDDDFENLMVKPLEKQSEKIEEKKEDSLIIGYWSSDKDGKIPISKANLDDLIYFQIKTSKKLEGKEIKIKLFEDDGILRKPDEQFPTISDDKKRVIKKELIKTIIVENQKAVVDLALEGLWDSEIKKDFGFEIELYWVAYQREFFFLGKRIYATLNVSPSLRYLYLNPPVEGYNLPELLTSAGETIIFAFGEANEVNDRVVEKLDNVRYFLGSRVLKSGNLVTNQLKVIKSEKARLYNYNLYNNDGIKVKVVKASNFGFKNIYVNNGKVVTTKGISQIDYFTNNGVLNNTLKLSKDIINLWDFTSLTDIMFKDSFETIPFPIPASWAVDILTQFVIIPHFNDVLSDLKEVAFIDFEKAKQKGLQACVEYIEKSTYVRKNTLKMKFLKTSTISLNKLLKGDFFTLKDFINYRDENTSSTTEWIHTIFYREEEDKYRGLIIVIECIFVSDKLINI